MTPTQLNPSQPARSMAQLGRGARGSSVSSTTTASVAAVPPAIAVRTTPPASTAATPAESASVDTAACGHGLGCSVRRTAAGTAIIRPNANVTLSILRSNAEPKPSCPSVSSSEDRTGAQTATRATTELHPPTAAPTRPRSIPARPRTAMTAARTRGRTVGPRTATDGTGLFSGQSFERFADAGGAFLQVGDDFGRGLLAEL